MPQRLRLLPHLLDEGAQQHGLAGARITGDEHDAAVARDGALSALGQHIEGMLAPQQPPRRRWWESWAALNTIRHEGAT